MESESLSSCRGSRFFVLNRPIGPRHPDSESKRRGSLEFDVDWTEERNGACSPRTTATAAGTRGQGLVLPRVLAAQGRNFEPELRGVAMVFDGLAGFQMVLANVRIGRDREPARGKLYC